MEAAQLRNAIASLKVSGKIIGDDIQDHWYLVLRKYICGENIPNEDIGQISDQELGRLSIYLLASDINWVPAEWHMNYQKSIKFQSPQMAPLGAIVHEDWNSFLADMTILMLKGLYYNLSTTADMDIRKAYQCYNKQAAILLTRPGVSQEQKNKLLEWIFIDPRHPESMLRPFWQNDVPDSMLIKMHKRLYSVASTGFDFHEGKESVGKALYAKFVGNLSSKLNNEEFVSRFGNVLIFWSGSRMINNGNHQPHKEVFSHLVSEGYLQHTNLTVADMEKIIELYPDKDMDDAVLATIKHVVLNTKHDWCAGLFLQYGQAPNIAQTIEDIIERFHFDKGLVIALDEQLNLIKQHRGCYNLNQAGPKQIM